MHLFLVVFLLAGCTAFDDDFFAHQDEQETKISPKKYQVSLKSATYYANKISFDDSIVRKVENIDPIVYGRDTLLYVVNFANNHGWLLLSGDKRTEALLATAQIGHFDKNNVGGASVWLNDMAGKLYGIKQANPQDTTSGSYQTWCNIDTLALGIKKRHPHMRHVKNAPWDRNNYGQKFDPSDPNYAEDILIDSKIEIKTNKRIDPLIKTKWGQGVPWNQYAPIWASSNKHCPVGCVAVAGAQMLYYLHYLKGKPLLGCDHITGGGIVYDKENYHNSYSFSNPSKSVWDNMPLRTANLYNYIDADKVKPVSILLIQVGMAVEMNYGEDGSGAQMSKLCDLYQKYGIHSEYQDYSPELILRSLEDSIPVNIEAYRNKESKKFLFIKVGEKYTIGHAWIIDGYRDLTIDYSFTYNRRPIQIVPPEYLEGGSLYDENRQLPPQPDPHNDFHYLKNPKFGILTETSTARRRFWTMNFGWDGISDDAQYLIDESDVWYTANGSFQYKKKIICNIR